MTRPVAILRPAPGDTATAARVRAAGLDPLVLPLFAVAPLDWIAPDPAGFDALLLTSANAVRHGGAQLARLAGLPVLAVGAETARVAAEAGLSVARVGERDLAALLVDQPGDTRLLWLAGRERTAIRHPAIRAVLPVYASAARALTPDQAARLSGTVALVHSARATRTLGQELDRHGIARSTLRLAAISEAALAADPRGWGRVAVAERPDDAALIAAARALAIDP